MGFVGSSPEKKRALNSTHVKKLRHLGMETEQVADVPGPVVLAESLRLMNAELQIAQERLRAHQPRIRHRVPWPGQETVFGNQLADAAFQCRTHLNDVFH